ncbi:hypothetical protein K7B10_00915, partial [Streptomyces flavotricini]|nr:hypothetical protein [Streptomyces flavotricini]
MHRHRSGTARRRKPLTRSKDDHSTCPAIAWRLVDNREAGFDAYTGPVYFMMHGVHSEERAREL